MPDGSAISRFRMGGWRWWTLRGTKPKLSAAVILIFVGLSYLAASTRSAAIRRSAFRSDAVSGQRIRAGFYAGALDDEHACDAGTSGRLGKVAFTVALGWGAFSNDCCRE